jgi:hypothetical protein
MSRPPETAHDHACCLLTHLRMQTGFYLAPFHEYALIEDNCMVVSESGEPEFSDTALIAHFKAENGVLQAKITLRLRGPVVYVTAMGEQPYVYAPRLWAAQHLAEYVAPLRARLNALTDATALPESEQLLLRSVPALEAVIAYLRHT